MLLGRSSLNYDSKYAKLYPEDPSIEGLAIMGVGQVYAEMGMDSLAIIYFQNSLNIKKEYSEKAVLLSALQIYTEFLQKVFEHEPEETVQYKTLQDSIENMLLYLSEETRLIEATNTRIRTLINLSRFYNETENNQKSLLYADSAYFLSKEIIS